MALFFFVTLYDSRELETDTVLIITVNCKYDKAASDIDAVRLLICHEIPGFDIPAVLVMDTGISTAFTNSRTCVN